MDEIEQLLAQLRDGELEAANRLFALLRPALVRTAQSRLDARLRRRLDASDVVQDALRVAAQRIGDYLSGSPVPFALWLRQIVLDETHKAWRRHGRAEKRSVIREASWPERSALLLARHLCRSGSSPSRRLTRQEEAARVRAGLERLSGIDQTVLEMRYFEEHSHATIGRMLGVSEDAARKQCVRALLRLSKALDEMGSAAESG